MWLEVKVQRSNAHETASGLDAAEHTNHAKWRLIVSRSTRILGQFISYIYMSLRITSRLHLYT